MKIEASNIALAATHHATASEDTQLKVDISFRQLMQRMNGEGSTQQEALAKRVQHMLDALVDAILAALQGKKCPENLAEADPSAGAADPADAGNGWQVALTQHVSESERTEVCGSGQVKTADGRCIDVSFALTLSRDFAQDTTLASAGRIVLHDPLMLSFDGRACELTDERMRFDLDADGIAERIPGLGAGTGMLVFDRNSNGRADDGRELFGAVSGDGFAELAALDDDGNGWVDEGDAAFARLGVWDKAGYQTLAQRGVGALYAGAVASPFSLKTPENQLLGQIRAAGLYLTETGQSGHLQQLDLAVVPEGTTRA